MFQDESHFEIKPLVRRVWSPDPRPIVRMNYQKNERKTVFGALDLDDGCITLAAGEAGNSPYFLAFLHILQDDYASYDDLFLVVDRASYHFLRREVLQLLKPTPRIHFVYIPPSSPECNPIEQLWRLIKRFIANKYYQNIFPLLSDILDWHQVFKPTLCRKYQKLFAA